MAAIGTAANYADVASRLDPGGKIDKIVELLNETNDILDTAMVIEGNLVTGHMTTVRKGLPAVAWRLLNYGVPKGKSKTAQVIDTCGMLEAYAEVDAKLVDLANNKAEFRLSEDRPFLEAMNQEMAQTAFYGNTNVNPEEFLGLSQRYGDLSADNAENIIDAAGTGSDNTSIWLVLWGPDTCHFIYPKGSTAGFKHQDLGEETLTDAAGGLYQGYRTHYSWDLGLTLRDWRFVVRIANIDFSDLTEDAATGADLPDLMAQAIELIRNMNMGKAAFYMRRDVRSFLRRQVKNANNVRLTMEEVAGKRVTHFDGIPVGIVEELTIAEARVT